MAQYLPYLVFLACPVGMGMMMWMMMRSGRGGQPQPPQLGDPRIADLESQIDELKAEQRHRNRDTSTRP